MHSQEGVSPLEMIFHLDPEFSVIGVIIARCETVADFAGDTSLSEPHTHFINQSSMG